MYPSELYTISEPSILRDARIMLVGAHPIQYNPVTRTLRIYDEIELEISPTNEPSQNEITVPARPVPSFAALYRNIIGAEDLVAEAEASAPGQILIVARNVTQLRTVLNTFTQWKTRRGQPVQILAPNGTGTTTADVQAVINNAYNTWNPPLESVLLVGDGGSGTTQFELPTYYIDECYTDHPYMQIVGNDILADVALGRLSMSSLAELQTMINRTINYERSPLVTDTTWFSRGWGYAGISHDVLSNQASIHFCVAMMHRAGLSDVPYDEHIGNVSASLINQRLNGGATFWAHRPSWIAEIMPADVSSINNVNKPFVALNLTCGSGDWYGTTMGVHEQLIRLGSAATPRGALAAMSTELYTTHPATNNIVACGTFQAVGINGARQPGVMYLNGKYHLWRNLWLDQPTGVTNFSYWNNIMGDVTANVWTGVPHPLQLTTSDEVELSQNNLTVTVRDPWGTLLPSAWVTAWKQSGTITTETYSRVRTNEFGIANLPLTNLTTGSLYIIATDTRAGSNAIPAVDTVQVVAATARPTIASFIIDDDGTGGTVGNGNGAVNPGEIIDIAVTLQNNTSTTLSNLRSRITTTDDRTTIINDSTGWLPIASGVTGVSTIPYRIQFHTTLRQADTVTFLLPGIGGALRVPVRSILLHVVSDSVIGQTVWSPGVTGQLAVQLQNNGGLALTTPTTVTLSCNTSLITISDASAQFSSLPLSTVVANYSDSWTATPSRVIVPGTQVTFTLHAVNGSILEDVSFTRSIGTRATTDPTGPDEYGYRMYDNTDVNYPHRRAYQWVEIMPSRGGSGTLLAIPDTGYNRDTSTVVSLPFVTKYYGSLFDSATICSNGWLAFGAQPFYDNFRNYHLPSQDGPTNLVAPMWDELFFEPQTTEGVYTWYDVSNHRYIVTWNAVTLVNADLRNEFQLIIFDPEYYPTPTGDAPLCFQYKAFYNADDSPLEPGFCTIGISDGNYRSALEYSYYNRYTAGSSPFVNSEQANRTIYITTAAPDTLLHWISPIAGSELPISLSTTFRWSGRSSLQAVRIQLNRNYPSGTWETLFDSTANDGTESWTVTGAATMNARFRVMARNGSEGDTVRGDISFIAPESGIRVVTPNGGEILPLGTEYRISWNHALLAGTARVELNRNYPWGTWQTLFASTSMDANGVNWTVTSPTSTTCRIRITSNDSVNVSDISDTNFTIATLPVISIAPNPIAQQVMLNDTLRIPITISNTGGSQYDGVLTPDLGRDGYGWLNAGEPGGPTYSWINTNSGSWGPWSTDITTDPIRLPFDFPYFGTNHRFAWMCTNGWVTLDDPNESATHNNQLMPFNQLGAMFAVLWDYYSVPEGNTRYLLDSVNQRATFTWRNVSKVSEPNSRLTFQLILQGDGSVIYQYDTLLTNTYTSTVGIQSTDHTFAATLFHADTVLSQNAIRFSTQQPWATVSQTTFSIPPNSSRSFTMLFDTRNGYQSEDVLNGQITLTGNSPHSPYIVPVSMYVVFNGVNDLSVFPKEWQLAQNFPNPFNPTTEIQFRVDKAASVRLDVFNTEGRLITTLVNRVLPVGRHRVQWNGENHAAGVYFYRMATESRTVSKKMILMK
ncbi:MAG: C25 family cysteine peptidase [bacterium]|nr:C25 family cysteine peptidase [bacterium]